MDNYSKVYCTPFSEQMAFNMDMFNYRFQRMMNIDTTQPDNKMEFLMVFDSTIMLFRALFLENRTDNYTLQNYFRNTGREETAQKIDNFLAQPFCDWDNRSRKNAMKFIADKFVCHLDNVTNEDIGLCNSMISHLMNPYFDHNFNYIVRELNNIIEHAPQIAD